MVINLKEICERVDMTQTEFSRITGISRYTVWKATEPAYSGLFNVTADRFYHIHCSLPELIPLPDDFFHYTRPGYMINKYLSPYSKKETLEKIPKRLYDSKDYFLYSYKEQIDSLFPNLFLPYYIDEDGLQKPYQGTAYIPFDKRMYQENRFKLETPVTWEQYKSASGADKELYDRYSTYNIRANLIFRHLSRKDFLSMLTSDIQVFMKKDVSFVSNRKLLEKIFEPYIIVRPCQEK